MKTADLEVALCTDARMVMGTFVAAASVRRWLDRSCRLRIHFVGFEWSADARRSLVRLRDDESGMTDIQFHTVSREPLAGAPICKNLGLETYLRLMLPDCLGDTDSVLYLDSDTLVLDGLAWEAFDEGESLAAVPDFYASPDWRPGKDKTLEARKWWFNCGVMIMDLKDWREAGACGDAFEMACGRNGTRLRLPTRKRSTRVFGTGRDYCPQAGNLRQKTLSPCGHNTRYGWPQSSLRDGVRK